MSASAIDILKAARAKIADREYWRKGLRPVGENSCCAWEAIVLCNIPHKFAERRRAFRALANAIGLDNGWFISDWNDAPERTHADVLAAFNLAIATLELS